MQIWNVVFNFCKKTITRDDIMLPIQNINDLTKSKSKTAWAHYNSLAHEPQSTTKAMQCMVRLLYAKFEKADLQAIVKDNCTYLQSSERHIYWCCPHNLSHFLMNLFCLENWACLLWMKGRAKTLLWQSLSNTKVHHSTIIWKRLTSCVIWECWNGSRHQNGYHHLS